jgi:hypothetical protein
MRMYATVKAKRCVYASKQGQAREKIQELKPRVTRNYQEIIRQEPQ